MLTVAITLYIISLVLTYNWKFVSLDHFPPISPPPCPACGNHKSVLFPITLFLIYKGYHTVFICVISLSITLFPCMLLPKARFFYGFILHMYILPHLYPFTYHLVSFHFLAIVNNAAINTGYKCLFKLVF